uniref:Uncharacterized protein n=1 Tax=Opuntia streptacantha TaxID=393608 RepID=A0A7C9ASR0_OPUST
MEPNPSNNSLIWVNKAFILINAIKLLYFSLQTASNLVRTPHILKRPAKRRQYLTRLSKYQSLTSTFTVSVVPLASIVELITQGTQAIHVSSSTITSVDLKIELAISRKHNNTTLNPSLWPNTYRPMMPRHYLPPPYLRWTQHFTNRT